VEDVTRRAQLQTAYDYLTTAENCPYKTFIEQYDSNDLPRRIPFYHVFQFPHIEAALWPCLYFNKHLCESNQGGGDSHFSAKRSFLFKILSSVMDYGDSFKLLRFHYGRWLYKTVSGAIESAKRFSCNPGTALDSKAFTPGYWQWQHAYLLDAVRQLGPPNIFITISPYEWTFPKPIWLVKRMHALGLSATHLPTLETIHIAHVLQELLRGYISGRGSCAWKDHLRANYHQKSVPNVKTYFYRFEFQQRGTLHVHYIAWLHKTTVLDIKRIAAHVPTVDETFAKTVYLCQKSTKPNPTLHVHDGPTEIDSENDTITLHRTSQDNDLNVRAYIDTIGHALKCSMDVQFTDRNGMLLRYVSSCVEIQRTILISVQFVT